MECPQKIHSIAVFRPYQAGEDLIADLNHLKRLMSKDRSQKMTAVPRKAARRWIRFLGWGLAAVVITLAAVKILPRFSAPQKSSAVDKPVAERAMLVVLPFENLSGPVDEYFADGITDEITSWLAAVHDLGVISRTSAMQYKKSDKPLKQIGDELGVDYVLEGTIR